MSSKTNGRRSVLMMVSSMLIFGTIGVFRRYIPVSSAFLACSRGMLGGLCILLFLRLKKQKPEGKIPRRALLGLAVSGMLIGFNWMLLFEAYNHTTVAVATLCYYMQPTIVMLLSPLFFRERLTPRKAACAAVAVAGMVLVSGVVHTGIAYVLYFGSMDGLRVQTVAILSYIDPVSALLFSAIMLREPLSVPKIVGAVMIIGSAVASEIKPGAGSADT